MSLELDDAKEEWNKYVEFHNVSLKAVEAVLIMIAILRSPKFRETGLVEAHREKIDFVVSGMHARFEAFLTDLEIFRENFLKNKAPKIFRFFEKNDAQENPIEISQFAISVLKLKEFKFPGFPVTPTSEAEVLTLTKPLHLDLF